jgi:hypothetical protein
MEGQQGWLSRKSNKRKHNADFRAWWDDRRTQLSKEFSFKTKQTKGTLGWIKRNDTQPTTSIQLEEDKNLINQKVVGFALEKQLTKGNKNAAKLGQEDIVRCLKVRIKPSTEQKKILQNYFGINRFVYNKTIDWVVEGKLNNSRSWKEIRDNMLNKEKNPEANQYEWLFEHSQVSKDLKTAAIKELCDSLVADREKKKVENEKKGKKIKIDKIQLPNLKYRTKKDKFQRFDIPQNGSRPTVYFDYTNFGFKFWTKNLNRLSSVTK